MLSCVVGTALLVCGVSPVWAAGDAPDGSPAASALVGGFALGDGLEGTIDEQTGAGRFAVPAGSLSLTWDSRGIGIDRFSLGAGWGLGTGWVQTEGGLWVFPASGGAYEADASSPSGLRGYTLGDLRFDRAPGVLPARDDGTRAEAAYEFVLRELEGVTTYFSETGDPLATIALHGDRRDWIWAEEAEHRLVSIVDPDGVATALDWQPDQHRLLVRPGSNTGADPATWTVGLSYGRVSSVTDPESGRVDVASEASGLVTQLSGTSGAETDVSWRPAADGVAKVERVATVGRDGEERSARTWRAVDDSSSSGWPATVSVPGAIVPGALSAGFSTVVGDGPSEVESTYNALGSLIRRVMTATTASGRSVLQEQSFTYPATDSRGTPAVTATELPKHWGMPTSGTTTFQNAEGGERSATQRTEFDEFGRVISETGVDGVATTYTYDPIQLEGAGDGGDEPPEPPVGLRVLERTIAPDGLITEVRHELDASRRAIVASTTFTGHETSALVEVARSEYTVDADGFVSEERVFGTPDAAGERGTPRITRWNRAIDLVAGTATLTETVGVGTDAEASEATTVSLVHGEPLSQIDAVGNRATATYDGLGRVLTVTDAAGRTTRTAYETVQHDGRDAVTVTTPDGVTTTEIRDEFGRVTQITDNIDDGVVKPGHVRTVESREYPVPGEVRSTDAWGAVTSSRVDVFGRTVETVAANGLRNVTVHDDVAGTATTGVTPTESLADAETTSTSLTDDAGRVIETSGQRADGVEVPALEFLHDGLGREIAATGGQVAGTTEYDARGNAVQQTLSPAFDEPMQVRQTFDAFGDAVQKTVAEGEHSYAGVEQTLDALGRVVREVDQAGMLTTTEYTADGLIAKRVTSTGQTTAFEYDATTRAPLTSTITSPTGPTVRTAYETDPDTDRLTAVFDPADRAGTELSYSYDAFGNLTSTTYPDGTTIAHTYDEHGRRVSTTDTVGATTTYTYDDAGLLTAATQTSAEGSPLASVRYTYDDFGRAIRVDRGNGVATDVEYSSTNQITRETTTSRGGAIADRSYTYDPNGRLTQRIDRSRDEASQPWSATTTTYAYDGYDRLTESIVHDGDTAEALASKRSHYEHSVAGDVVRETVTTAPGTPAERSVTRDFGYSPSGELTAITTTETDGSTSIATQEYDVNGNLTRDLDGTVFSYDAANRLIQDTTADGTTTSTSYWADGSRRQLTADGGEGADGPASTAFYWDGATLINDAHSRAGDRATASYLLGGTRAARTVVRDPGQRDGVAAAMVTSYLGTDRHGNTTDLTDAQGVVTTRYDYTDYGVADVRTAAPAAVGDADRNPIQYAAAYADPSGRLHLDARDYDPGTARFMTADRARELTNYAYADLNPVMKVDPSGRNANFDEVVNYVVAGWGLLMLGLTISALATAPIVAGFDALYTAGVLAGLGQATSVSLALVTIAYDHGSLEGKMTQSEREAFQWAGIVIGVAADFAGTMVVPALFARRFAGAGALGAADEVGSATVKSQTKVGKQVEVTAYAGKTTPQIMRQLGSDVQKNATQLIPSNNESELLVKHGKTFQTGDAAVGESGVAALQAQIEATTTLIDDYVKSLRGVEVHESILDQTNSLISTMRKDLTNAAEAAGLPRPRLGWGLGPKAVSAGAGSHVGQQGGGGILRYLTFGLVT